MTEIMTDSDIIKTQRTDIYVYWSLIPAYI